jgi:Flp pilus assembly protein protease CpaA
MLPLYITLLSMHICIHDLRFLKVLNLETAFLLVLLFSATNLTSLSSTLLSAVVSIFCFLLLKIGMGDLKLWLVLIATEGAIVLSMDFLLRAFAIAALLVAVTSIRRGTMKGSIAFAPVLLLPFLSLYLGI